MKAHQRIIRERRASEDSDADLFGRWWRGIDARIENAEIREVSYDTAWAIIEKYEWLGSMPGMIWHCYGIFFSGCCGGVVVYGPEYAENLGVWNKYGYTGKIIALLRGACVHWANPNAASHLIRGSMRLLPAKYQIITCTTDRTAGEIGTIYQACGFDFVGPMSRGKRASIKAHDSNSSTHVGRATSARHLGRKYGTQGYKALRAMGIDVEEVPGKGRYFAFRGPRAAKKKHRAAIRHIIKPYPKRAEQVSSRDTVSTPDKAGGSSPAPLQQKD